MFISLCIKRPYVDKNHDLGILCTLQPLDLKGRSPGAQVTNLSPPSPAGLASLGSRGSGRRGQLELPGFELKESGEGRCLEQTGAP